MPTRAELLGIARQAIAEGDEATAHKAMDMIDKASGSSPTVGGRNPDIPQVDENGVYIPQERSASPKQERELSLTENPIVGAAEAGIATVGGLAGLGGQIAGTVKGIGQSVADGTFGTQAGAQSASEEALRLSQKFSAPFQPRTQTGQEYTQELGEFAEPFAAAAPFAHELAIIGNSARAALPMGTQVSDGAAQAIRNISDKKAVEPAAAEPIAPKGPQGLADAFANSGMKNRVDEITSNITLNPERVAAAKRLGLEPPIATLSDDASLHEIAGALAASPGSKAAANLADYHKALTDRSKQLIEEAGGDLDKGLVSNQLKDKIDANIKLLSSQSGDIYKQIDAAVPADTIVNAKPLLRELNSRGSKSQNGISGLSSVEKDVYKTLQGKPTYFDIDNLRKDIGESIGGIKGSYPTASSSTLKDMYGKLTQIQEGVATQVGNGAGSLWAQAKELDKSRFALQDNAQFLFGKDLNGAVIPKVEQGLKQLAKGDPKILNAVIENIPAEMKHRVLVSGLDGMLSKSAQGENAISPAQFNKWYGDLSRSQTNKKLLHDNLPEGAGQRLDDMFKLSQGMQNVTNKVVRTGIVHDAFKNFDKNGGLIDRLYNTADKIANVPIIGAYAGAPAVRLGSNVLKMAAKEKTPAVQAADDLLADPAFRTAVLSYEKGSKGKSAAQEKLKQRPSYKNFIKSVNSIDDKTAALIVGGGLVPFLIDSESVQDDE